MKKFLIFSLLVIPTFVFASSGNDVMDISTALFMEAFVSIHMSVFVLMPLSKIISKTSDKEEANKKFWILFAIRALVLLFFDFFITTGIAIVDFFAVFVGAFIILPLGISKTGSDERKSRQLLSQIEVKTEPTCSKCNSVVKADDKFCSNCGNPIDSIIQKEETIEKEFVKPTNFDPIYSKDENSLLEEFIDREITKAGIDLKSGLMPSEILKRKNILNIIFSILLFVYISLVFFHFPLYTYIIGFILLIVFINMTSKYDLKKYIIREVKARPSEKISNIVMNIKNSLIVDDKKIIRDVCVVVAIILPLFIFKDPRILYEKQDNGYAVRFYTFGLTNFKTATIEEKYKGEDVVALRGNTFSNMPFLEKVTLPNTIIEIRGQAFKNDKKLISVNIPNRLEYLGGGAFYNCTSLETITLPDTLTEMGGETFYNAKSLKYIKLPSNLSEIRGDSFEYCESLSEITIPDSVTRIGGHAFYGCNSLKTVNFTQNSKLKEIGSSAFRQCNSLYTITLPYGVDINERAFKESPTSITYFNVSNTSIVAGYQNRLTHDFKQDEEFELVTNGKTVKIKLNYSFYSSHRYSFIVTDDIYHYVTLSDTKSYEKVSDDLLMILSSYDDDYVRIIFYYK